jgi:spore germination protein
MSERMVAVVLTLATLMASGCARDATTGGGAGAPSALEPKVKVAGWLPTWTGSKGRALVTRESGQALDECNAFWYGLKTDGTLKVSSSARNETFIEAIQAAGGEFIPTIHDVADRDATAAVLASSSLRTRFVAEVVLEMETYGYDGIDIDFEHVKSSNKDRFHLLLAELRDALHARGKILSIAIPGKRRPSPSWTGYDYEAVGPLVDRFKIMTYGAAGPWSSKPGPVAPTTWIRKVLDYAVTKVAPEKIYIGIPFYGFDWPANGAKVRSVTWSSAQSKLAKSSAGMVYDEARGSTMFEYRDAGVDHTVWFEDDRSIAAKTALVEEYQVAGIAIWALGYGADSFWTTISEARRAAASRP